MIRILGVGNILITGLQGAGKSHFIMSQVKQILEEKPEFKVYIANVEGIKLQSPNLQIVDENFSWVDDAQNNSLIIYDEAGTIERFNNTHRTISSHKDVQQLTMARHQNKTLVFVGQDSSIIHPGIRRLLTRHFHFSNPYNNEENTHCFVFPQVQDRLDGQNKSWQKNAVEEFKHQLDPQIFPLYKSVDDGVKHSKVKQYNQKAKRAFIVAFASALLVIPTIIFAIYFAFDYYKGLEQQAQKTSTKQEIAPQKAQTTSQTIKESTNYIQTQNDDYSRKRIIYKKRLQKDYDVMTTDPAIKPSAVIKMGDKCAVYNSYGDLMNYDKSECEWFLKEVGRLPKSRSNARLVSSHDEQQTDEQTPQNETNNAIQTQKQDEPINSHNDIMLQ